MANQLAIHGSQCTVYLNNNLLGITNSFSYTIDYNVTVNRGIDLMGPVEVSPRII